MRSQQDEEKAERQPRLGSDLHRFVPRGRACIPMYAAAPVTELCERVEGRGTPPEADDAILPLISFGFDAVPLLHPHLCGGNNVLGAGHGYAGAVRRENVRKDAGYAAFKGSGRVNITLQHNQ